jgi:dimethylhistidine N-methyltransferase
MRGPAEARPERDGIVDDVGDFCEALLHGLSREEKHIPCKYFYDREGSRLFEKICALPEYYPTRVEHAILRRYAGEFAALIGGGADIVEFGAGSTEKVRLLLDRLDHPHAYLPVDISGPYLRLAAARLKTEYPQLHVLPIVADFSRTFDLPPSTHRRVGFFPGSTIGNFEPREAREFLANAARMLKGGGLLIGVDLVKDPAILHAAYNDGQGITAAFNRNLLVRANRELGANFEPARFFHYAPYDPARSRIGMYLLSAVAQRVSIRGRQISFAEGEAIHTEWSHKHTLDGFRTLAADAGFVPRAVWCDPDRLFSVHWLEAP